MLAAALAGDLDGVETRTDELFGFAVPVEVPGVDAKLLDPRSTWRDPAAYDATARELAEMFVDNFEELLRRRPSVRVAGPSPCPRA